MAILRRIVKVVVEADKVPDQKNNFRSEVSRIDKRINSQKQSHTKMYRSNGEDELIKSLKQLIQIVHYCQLCQYMDKNEPICPASYPHPVQFIRGFPVRSAKYHLKHHRIKMSSIYLVILPI